MSTNTQLLTEQDVIRMMASLCELLASKDSSSKKCTSEKLLRDQVFREKVLRSAAQSEDHQLRRIAYKLLRVDMKKFFPDQANQDTDIESIGTNSEKTHVRQPSEETQRIFYKESSREIFVLKSVIATLFLILIVSVSILFWGDIDNLLDNSVEISGSIVENTRWTADKEYILTDVIYVENGATLTIEAGANIKGNKGSALLVTRESQLIARGTAEKPVVFTSGQLPGQRSRGDWGGVVLLGNAPINRGDSAHIEGIPEQDQRGDFGGNDTRSSCGILEYVRIEFAGYEVYTDNELNGLTLGGCGVDTIIRHVQVHKALDDGIEVFGGTVSMKHVVVTGAKDDSFDWDMGWQGNVQFLVIQQHLDGGDNGFEGDNFKKKPFAKPISNPSFYNVTMVGANSSQIAQRAMNLRRGSGGFFSNFIVTGFSKEAVDLRGDTVSVLVKDELLNHNNMLFYSIGKNGKYFSDEEGKDDDDAGFSESNYFALAENNNIFGLDPRLPPDVYNPTEPDFTPYSHSPARKSNAKIPQGEFWDEGANYLGAIRPGIARNWLQGWTAYPSN